jgi:Tfp pilus assembly protein PilO
MRTDLSVIITIFLFCLALMLVSKVFWPVLLVLVILGVIGYLKSKHDAAKAEEEYRTEQENLEEELFRKQVQKKKRENAEIIEAEFTEKEDSTHDHN